MKKRFFYLLFALLCLLCAMVFVSCDDKENTPPTCDHSDADGNALCDKCGEAYTAAADNAIGFKTLTVNGTNVYGKVSNKTTVYSFFGEVSIKGNATFEVYRDAACTEIVGGELPELVVGDNLFYIREYIGGEEGKLYTVTIRRKHLYTVSFDTADGTAIPAQTVEEDTVATRPADPERTGYTFTDWAYDFTTPVTGDITIVANWQGNPYTVTYDANGGAVTTPTLPVTFGATYTLQTPTREGYTFAGWYKGNIPLLLTGTWNFTENVTLVAKWTPNSGTPYKVEHYTENLDGTWHLQDTDNLFGTSDSKVTPLTKTYTGFTAPQTQQVTVAPDGSLLVRYEYTRNRYTVTFVTNGGDAIAAQTLKYGEPLPTPVRTGYTFGGWLFDNILPTTTLTVPANDTTLYAYWAEENKPCDFMFSGMDQITIADFVGKGTEVCIPAYIGGNPVTSIGFDAFLGCTGLTSITIPESVTSIGSFAFSGCSGLTSITIPESVTSIGTAAFSDCTGLTSITIPESVTSIGTFAFSGCTSLASITVASGNTVYHSAGNCLIETATKTLVFGCKNSVIPTDGSVTSIGSFAFYGCTGLTSITIPASVTSIDWDAFYGCTGLTSITIPASVTSIDSSAFSGCTDLESITVASGNTTYHSAGNCLIETATKTLILGCKNSVIPTDGSVTNIGNSAFSGCTGLTSITIPVSVITIGDDTFRGCSSLASVNFGENSQLQSIGNTAFYRCTGLTSITIPASVTSIDSSAFSGCTDLESITVASGNTVYHSAGNCLIETATKTLILGCKNSVIPTDGSVTAIGSSAFSGRTGLTSITIPESVTTIGDNAFFGCTGLTSITIPASVTTIGVGAFYGCTSLASITIPASVTSIGVGAFSGCTGLASITVDSGNTVYHSAGNCLIETATKTLVFGCKNSVIPTDGSVTTIGSSAFRGCTGLTSITIPVSVTSIGWDAFSGCTSLTSVTFKQTSGWKADGVNISPADLANTATAAEYLTVTYLSYGWNRS